jgi:SAM-dependent methyltransferase
MESDYKKHWEKIFSTKAEEDMSWFQPYPKTSVEFLQLFSLSPDANVIDVGSGDSHFVDVLVSMGYRHIYSLDISSHAIERLKKRLGDQADRVNYIVSDVVDFNPTVKFDFWHDRAAFHFLTDEKRVERYIAIAEEAIRPGGYLILGTFSEKGPEKCSGLEIRKYTEVSMSARFYNKFEKIRCMEEEHLTPFNTSQSFLFCSFRRKS